MHRRSWSARNAWPLCCGIAVGILIAFPLAAPLMGGKILEPVATLWGNALGAAAAVSGAMWVAERQMSSQRRNTAALAHAIFLPFAMRLEELRALYGTPTRLPLDGDHDEEPDILAAATWSAVLTLIDLLISTHGEMGQKIHRVEAALNGLAPSELESVFFLEAEFAKTVRDCIEPLRQRAGELGLRFYPGHASLTTRISLAAFCRHINDEMLKLKLASR